MGSSPRLLNIASLLQSGVAYWGVHKSRNVHICCILSGLMNFELEMGLWCRRSVAWELELRYTYKWRILSLRWDQLCGIRWTAFNNCRFINFALVTLLALNECHVRQNKGNPVTEILCDTFRRICVNNLNTKYTWKPFADNVYATPNWMSNKGIKTCLDCEQAVPETSLAIWYIINCANCDLR